MSNKLFYQLNLSHIEYSIPELFTYPFYYQPNTLARLAASDLQKKLEVMNLNHNFGLNPNQLGIVVGKMFGVLVCKNELDEIGYIAGVSGELLNSDTREFLVPSISKKIDDNLEKKQIEEINEKIIYLENSQNLITLKAELLKLKNDYESELKKLQTEKANAKIQRKMKRELGLDENDLIKESIFFKKKIEIFKKTYKQNIEILNEQIDKKLDEIKNLKDLRAKILKELQFKIFNSYNFLNFKNESTNILELFNDAPPSGAGDCAAPKLLQFAYLHNLKPICMAEFWWGAPHKSSIRKHLHFYPACRSKCEPILNFMLKGLNVENNPMSINYGENKEIKVLYEDSDLIVIDKPEGLLSVPGKLITDSVATRFHEYMIVHRLDQETSGIMVLAKNKQAHKNLQEQFISKKIQKKYRAILSGKLEKNSGEIELPIRLDLDNRPQQMVCYNHGKHSKTFYNVIKSKDNETYIEFIPITGRTHQLRVHSAHCNGLNTPIKGDTLYGEQTDRLYLHAYNLIFKHPKNNELINIVCNDHFKF